MPNTASYLPPAVAAPTATPPTAQVMQKHQSLSVLITGDGSATSIVLTHNWGLSTAEQNAKYPWVFFEAILAAGITAAPEVTARDANTITVTNVAFTGAGLIARLQRPLTILR
jgi:hypothetical protein